MSTKQSVGFYLWCCGKIGKGNGALKSSVFPVAKTEKVILCFCCRLRVILVLTSLESTMLKQLYSMQERVMLIVISKKIVPPPTPRRQMQKSTTLLQRPNICILIS